MSFLNFVTLMPSSLSSFSSNAKFSRVIPLFSLTKVLDKNYGFHTSSEVPFAPAWKPVINIRSLAMIWVLRLSKLSLSRLMTWVHFSGMAGRPRLPVGWLWAEYVTSTSCSIGSSSYSASSSSTERLSVSYFIGIGIGIACYKLLIPGVWIPMMNLIWSSQNLNWKDTDLIKTGVFIKGSYGEMV